MGISEISKPDSHDLINAAAHSRAQMISGSQPPLEIFEDGGHESGRDVPGQSAAVISGRPKRSPYVLSCNDNYGYWRGASSEESYVT